MTKIERQLIDLTNLAREWLEFSEETNGWTTVTHRVGDIEIRCYFATAGDHTAVDFGDSFNSGIAISFFSEIKLELTMQSLHNLDSLLIKATKGLKTVKIKEAKTSKQEKENRKSTLIKQHQEALKELMKGE